MTQLYALTGKLAELQAMAATDDEGLKEALQHAMDEIQGEFGVKADNIVMLRRNIESDVTAIDSEIERLAELKRIKSNSVAQISDYLRREGKRERFQKWVMATKHPVFGFLDGRSLARNDDHEGYADEYVQGLWVAFNAFGTQFVGEPAAWVQFGEADSGEIGDYEMEPNRKLLESLNIADNGQATVYGLYIGPAEQPKLTESR